MKKARGYSDGFTLIELIIVVAIIGIITTIATPAYFSFVEKSRRADGMAALSSFAGAMERHFTVNGTYCGSGPSSSSDCSTGTHTGDPSVFPTEAPLDGSDKYYDLDIQAVTATTFTLTATPKGVHGNDSCGTLQLSHTGSRSAASADCWP